MPSVARAGHARMSHDEADGAADRGGGAGRVGYLLDGLHTRIRSGDFATASRSSTRIGGVAEEMNHHPDLTLRYPHLDVRLTSHDEQGVHRPRHPARPRPSPPWSPTRGFGWIHGGLRTRVGPGHPGSAVDPAVLGARCWRWSTWPGPTRRRPARPGRRAADGVVPGVGPRGAPAALAPRPLGRSRRGAAAHQRGVPRAAPWSATPRRRASGCSPTRRATGSACAPGRTAADTRRRQERSAL